MEDKPEFIKKAEKKAQLDYEDCIARIQDVLTRTDIENDCIMDIHFDALYSMMKEKGYSMEEVQYIMDIC